MKDPSRAPPAETYLTSQPNERIAIYLLGPLSTKQRRSEQIREKKKREEEPTILSAVNHFTRYAGTFPMGHISFDSVAWTYIIW